MRRFSRNGQGSFRNLRARERIQLGMAGSAVARADRGTSGRLTDPQPRSLRPRIPSYGSSSANVTSSDATSRSPSPLGCLTRYRRSGPGTDNPYVLLTTVVTQPVNSPASSRTRTPGE